MHSRPGTETPALAESLYVLAVYLYTAGQLQESFAMAWEAIDIYRQLVRTNPAPHTADLARALNILTLNLSRAGRAHEALAAVQEAVTFYRSLAQIDPAAYKPDLAACLHNLATCLSDVGDRSAASPRSERRRRSVGSWQCATQRRTPRRWHRACTDSPSAWPRPVTEARPWRPHGRRSPPTGAWPAGARRTSAGGSPARCGTYASVLEWAGREADAARIRQESEAMTEEKALEDSIRGF